MRLFIDDERNAPPEYTDHARTVEEAIDILKRGKRENDHLELVSFDYDAHSHLNWTFVKIAEWMRDNNVWPDLIRIHTANYWMGRPYLEAFFEAHAPKHVEIDTTDPWDPDPIDFRPDWVYELYKANQ